MLLTACGTTEGQQTDVTQNEVSEATKPLPNATAVKPESANPSKNAVNAPVSTGQDSAGGARFSLDGPILAVTLSTSSRVRGFAGQDVRVDCVSQRRQGDGAARTVRWPPRMRTLKVRLPRSAGLRPVFCSVDTASLSGRSYHVDAVLT